MPPHNKIIGSFLLSGLIGVGSALAAESVRIATWNVETIGAQGTTQYLAAKQVLDRIDADVVAVQEIASAADETYLAYLATDLGYPHVVVAPGGPFGSDRTAFMSTFPLSPTKAWTAAELANDPQANDLTRYILSAQVTVDRAIDPLHVAVSHWKSGSSNTDEYRRAIDSRRMAQVADTFLRQSEPYVLMGDINADIGDGPQTPAKFTSIPTGLPTSFVTGADMKSLVLGTGLPNDPFGPLTALASLVDAKQLDGTDATRPSSGRRLDYLLISPALATAGAQVYDCKDENLPGGLPLHGTPLPASVCPTASDHLPVLADLVIPTITLPTLRISDVTQAEGQRGTRAFAFTVRLSQTSTITLRVRYATVAGTAQAGSDFVTTSGTLTFVPGQTSKTVTVPVKGDTQQEANETFKVRLSNPTGATLADAVGLGTILNDDGPVLKINAVAQLEGNAGLKRFNFVVSLSAKSTRPVTVRFATANGQAFAGSDYVARSGLLTFSPGQTSKTVAIEVKGDTLKEPNENFQVNLSSPTGATIFTGRGIGTIRNDD